MDRTLPFAQSKCGIVLLTLLAILLLERLFPVARALVMRGHLLISSGTRRLWGPGNRLLSFTALAGHHAGP